MTTPTTPLEPLVSRNDLDVLADSARYDRPHEDATAPVKLVKLAERRAFMEGARHVRDIYEADRVKREEVIAAALEWWENHRPLGWTEEQHREQFQVNLGGKGERLAALLSKLNERTNTP